MQETKSLSLRLCPRQVLRLRRRVEDSLEEVCRPQAHLISQEFLLSTSHRKRTEIRMALRSRILMTGLVVSQEMIGRRRDSLEASQRYHKTTQFSRHLGRIRRAMHLGNRSRHSHLRPQKAQSSRHLGRIHRIMPLESLSNHNHLVAYSPLAALRQETSLP